MSRMERFPEHPGRYLSKQRIPEWLVRRRTSQKRDAWVAEAALAVKKCGGNPTQVYAIKSGDFVKFGVSRTPEKRLGSIKTDNPHQTELLGNLWASTFVEKQIHWYLGPELHQGEWFKWTARTQAIAALITAKDLDGLLQFIEYIPSKFIMGIPAKLARP